MLTTFHLESFSFLFPNTQELKDSIHKNYNLLPNDELNEAFYSNYTNGSHI